MKKVFVFIATVLFAISSWARTVGTGRYDQQIQQEASKALSSKDKWKGITASTDDGIVTLQGTTKLLIDKLDAAKKVDKLEHAQGVLWFFEFHGQVAGVVINSEVFLQTGVLWPSRTHPLEERHTSCIEFVVLFRPRLCPRPRPCRRPMGTPSR